MAKVLKMMGKGEKLHGIKAIRTQMISSTHNKHTYTENISMHFFFFSRPISIFSDRRAFALYKPLIIAFVVETKNRFPAFCCAMNLIIGNEYLVSVSIEMWCKRCVVFLFLVVSDFCSGNDG